MSDLMKPQARLLSKAWFNNLVNLIMVQCSSAVNCYLRDAIGTLLTKNYQ